GRGGGGLPPPGGAAGHPDRSVRLAFPLLPGDRRVQGGQAGRPADLVGGKAWAGRRLRPLPAQHLQGLVAEVLHDQAAPGRAPSQVREVFIEGAALQPPEPQPSTLTFVARTLPFACVLPSTSTVCPTFRTENGIDAGARVKEANKRNDSPFSAEGADPPGARARLASKTMRFLPADGRRGLGLPLGAALFSGACAP